MATVKKVGISEVQGGDTAILPAGTLVMYNIEGEGWQLRLHNGVDAGGLPIYSDANVVSLLASFGSNTISTTGDITANSFIGDGSQLTNLPFDASKIENGTSNVEIATANGNVTITANTSKTWTFDTNGDLTVPNYINFKDGTFIGDEGGAGTPVFRIDSPLGLGINLTTDSDMSGNNYTWSFGIDGVLSAPGNISTSSDITANSFIGDGSQLTGLPASYSNADVATFLADFGSNTISTTGNVTAGVLISSGSIYGNIDLILGNIANASGTKTRITTFGTNSYIQTGNGTAGSTGNIVFAPYLDATEKVVINTATGNVTAQNFVGNISITGNVTGTSANVELVAGAYTATFDNTGSLTVPNFVQGGVLKSTNSIGNEGGEIQLAASPSANIGGVIIDSYNDIVRIFENGGTSRGVYVDLTKAPAGVGGELQFKASGIVNAGTFVTLDNIKATVTTSGNRGLSLAAVSGSFNAIISATYVDGGGVSGSFGSGTVNTTPSTSQFGWNFTGTGNTATFIITDTTNSRAYRVTMMIGASFNNNLISIERLV